MDLRPSPAQQLLVATAREVLSARADEGALWRRMAELGWPGLLVPPELSGSGGSLLDVVLLVEAMGRAAAPGPFVPSAVIATSLLLAAGNTDQRKRWLPAMAAGDRIVTVALPVDGATAGVKAGRLSGRALFVQAADVADAVLVAAGPEHEPALLLVPSDRPGLTRHRLDTIGGDPVFELVFDHVSLGAEDRLLASDARAALASALDAGALARTAEMVGAAQRVLELAVEHAKTRVQGGRPIGGYQAIQHACADLVRDVDASRGLLYAAAWKASEGLPAAADVAMAKAYAGEACLAVARQGHQIFGAIGYCEEHPLHMLHKRILAASLDCGDTAQHLETIARAIGLR
jgi:alkylation response protein AidB-like acyl-CoA dehydrogenase